MLENHVGEFISKWKIGLGMYAEQGGERIHPEFNELFKRYSCMPSDIFLSYMVELQEAEKPIFAIIDTL